ncbi:hypothetical protein [Bdellovibrio svalbardensis]|uniref:Uncharacterized protein n=1 Tax=Bdellovibrio svalbardensis TaxID=2972972 RepID=A0ABT6DLH2_9BACT|nr:hypothetical protein [Bdellovibrio svalbardensis]MDG0817722.1 hypothetical protein [Bdellovibrio svalbardensis]
MKKALLAAGLVITFVSPVFAGKMKDIYIDTRESVMDYLGFDESIISIEGMKFVQVEGADVAVETIARGYYSRSIPAPTFKCVTIFKKQDFDSYLVVGTKCQQVP